MWYALIILVILSFADFFMSFSLMKRSPTPSKSSLNSPEGIQILDSSTPIQGRDFALQFYKEYTSTKGAPFSLLGAFFLTFLYPLYAVHAETPIPQGISDPKKEVPLQDPLAERSAREVKTIRIEGLLRIDPEKILEFLIPENASLDAKVQEHSAKAICIKPLQSYYITNMSLNTALKKLYATGLFTKIDLSIHDSTLIVSLAESKSINQIVFEGNEALKDDVLKAAIKLKPRDTYNPQNIYETARLIKALYAYKGRLGAIITPYYIEREQNRVDVIFSIQEGPVVALKAITFRGNTIFNDEVLKSIISTQESIWWRFWSHEDSYDSDRVRVDEHLLREFYVQNGYIDVEVESSTAELVPDENSLYLTFSIKEGKQYVVATASVKAEEDVVLPEEAQSALQDIATRPVGHTFNPKEIQKHTEEMVEIFHKNGIFSLEVVEDLRKADTGTLNLTFHVQKKGSVSVRRIDIEGNTFTKDSVIRRSSHLVEKGPLTKTLLKHTQDSLNSLPFFEEVSITRKPTNSPHKEDILIQVKEKKTGSAFFHGGWSADEKFLVGFKLAEENFLGNGVDVNLTGTLAQRETSLIASYTDPFFIESFNRRIGLLVDLSYVKFRGNTKAQSLTDASSTYTKDAIGLVTTFDYNWNSAFKQYVGYGIQHERIYTKDIAALRRKASEKDSTTKRERRGPLSPYLIGQQGKYWDSFLCHSLVYNKRNRNIFPSRGYYLRYNQNFHGLGGDVAYLKQDVSGSVYIPFNEKESWVGCVSGFYGWISPFSKQKPVRIIDTYFAGNTGFPGFAESGIGPRDRKTGDALGGKNYFKVQAEIIGPLPFVSHSLGIRVGPYMVAGSIWKPAVNMEKVPEEERNSIMSEKFHLRCAAGLKVVWFSPLGATMKFYIMHPLAAYEEKDPAHPRRKIGDRKLGFIFDIGI